MRPNLIRKLGSTELLLFSFAAIIALGTVILLLPVSAKNESLTFVEALFTATSATCVTGLTVIDIGTRLTFTGQLVVLLLIQAGGLGIMTFSIFFSFLISRRFTLREREILQQTISQHPIKNLQTLLVSVILVTITIEMVGAVFYWWRFTQDYSIARAGYLALFHSISAFCNAGFSLFSNSMMDYSGDFLVNIVTCVLIVLGGLGFIVYYDLRNFIFHRKKNRKAQFSYHSRIILTTTALLIVSGAILFFIFEWRNSFQSAPWSTKILASFFQSITSRTAGFNTLDIGRLSNATLMLLCLLMLVGASPASCGGGIKTSTFAIIIAMIKARFLNREDVNLSNRRVPQEVVSKAIAITFFSVFVIALFTLILVYIELGGLSHAQTRGSYLEILFEVFSAFGTVGLSTGITPEFSSLGRILLIMLMYIGRLGPLTLAIAIAGRKTKLPYRYAEDNILVG